MSQREYRSSGAIIAAALMIVTFASCVTAPARWEGDLVPAKTLKAQQIDWEQIAPGIEYAMIASDSPKLALYCAKIDLRQPNISVVVTGATPAGGKETRLLRTTTFAKRYGTIVAINATPFDAVYPFEGIAVNIVGAAVSDGVTVSPAEEAREILTFSRGGPASILSCEDFMNVRKIRADDAYNAVSGFGQILKGGKNLCTGNGSKDVRTARTAAGISADGETLYLLVIDGKDASHSIGVSFSETAEWIAFFGADSAIMLDGGGSSTFVLGNGETGVRLVNRPIQKCVPNFERPVANQLGIRSEPEKASRTASDN